MSKYIETRLARLAKKWCYNPPNPDLTVDGWLQLIKDGEVTQAELLRFPGCGRTCVDRLRELYRAKFGEDIPGRVI